DSTRLADRGRHYGMEVDLRIWENMIHVWPVFIGFGLPESQIAIEEIAEFIQTNLALEAHAQSTSKIGAARVPRPFPIQKQITNDERKCQIKWTPGSYHRRRPGGNLRRTQTR